MGLKKNSQANIKNSTTTNQKKSSSSLNIILKNFTLFFLSILIFNTMLKNDGYNWAWDTLIKSNLKIIKENKTLSIQNRVISKMGDVANYMYNIKNNTNDTATILFPDKKNCIRSKNKISGEFHNKTYVSYFLYPRTIIYAHELLEYKNIAKSIDYVAIIEGCGYEFLPYETQQKTDYTFMPIKKAAL